MCCDRYGSGALIGNQAATHFGEAVAGATCRQIGNSFGNSIYSDTAETSARMAIRSPDRFTRAEHS